MSQLTLFDGDGSRVIYFLDCADFVKIGQTDRSIRARCGELQTGNPYALGVIGSIRVPAHVTDADIQAPFERWRHRGDWFRKSPVLVEAITALIAVGSVLDPSSIRVLDYARHAGAQLRAPVLDVDDADDPLDVNQFVMALTRELAHA
jgi:hypothetical protein